MQFINQEVHTHSILKQCAYLPADLSEMQPAIVSNRAFYAAWRLLPKILKILRQLQVFSEFNLEFLANALQVCVWDKNMQEGVIANGGGGGFMWEGVL